MSVPDWLEQHLLACPYKAMLGRNCPGCGMQRAFIALLRGELSESFFLYPALIPFLLTLIFLLLHLKFRFKNGAMILMYAFIVVTVFIVVNFIVKEAL